MAHLLLDRGLWWEFYQKVAPEYIPRSRGGWSLEQGGWSKKQGAWGRAVVVCVPLALPVAG